MIGSSKQAVTASFASTRSGALRQLEEFVSVAGRYASRRNYVTAEHTNVSRLSPAISHGLISLEECVDAVRKRYRPSTVEKFLQELAWRRYWKSWLSLRPQVWADYTRELDLHLHEPEHRQAIESAKRVEAGESRVAIMNHFVQELTTTGYMHNHARMWFAAWWVHVERLPWVLGADLFMRHLLDADAASNTLSWRWVAGLQTPGKTYLPRRSNLEKYLDHDILATQADGLELLENPVALQPDTPEKALITRPQLSEETPRAGVRSGIWVHDEDLCIERGPLAESKPKAILLVPRPVDKKTPTHKIAWRQQAFNDAVERVRDHYGVPASQSVGVEMTDALCKWARDHNLQQILTMRPEVGLLDDEVEIIREALMNQGVRLVLVDREEILDSRSLATGGFFGYWKKIQSRGWFGTQ